MFSTAKDLKEPFIVRESDAHDEYNERVKEGSGVGEFSGAVVPLVNGEVTEGSLGFLQFRARRVDHARDQRPRRRSPPCWSS